MAYNSGELGDIRRGGMEQESGRQDIGLQNASTGGSYGGYNGTWVTNPDGTRTFDTTQSGRAASVGRARGLGAAAANRGAYQNDYGLAEINAAQGQDDRARQAGAAQLAHNVAINGNAATAALGQRMIQGGVQAQQAAAMSTRGGPLAAAAAMRQQQNGQGAFVQQANTNLQAQRADDMATGRDMYSSTMGDIRAGDAEAQRLHQQQAIHQMGNEIDQRQLGQQGQMGYEEMGQNINKSAQDAALRNEEMGAGIDAAASLRGQRQADRDLAHIGEGVQAGGTLVAGLSTLGGSDSGPKGNGGYSDGIYHDDPYSDARAKFHVRSLASAAAMRGGFR